MIQCYTDKQILSELFTYYSHSCCIVYSSYLKKACEIYSLNYYDEYYFHIESLNYSSISIDDYVKELKKEDMNIGNHKHLGEIKTYVLL